MSKVGGGERGNKGGVLLLAHSCSSVGWGIYSGGERGLKRINIFLWHNCFDSALNTLCKDMKYELIEISENLSHGEPYIDYEYVMFL